MNVRNSVPIVFSLLMSSAVWSGDIRSMSMGGAGITAGKGTGGVFSNPALIMDGVRSEKGFGLFTGTDFEVRDSSSFLANAEENDSLFERFDDELDAITGQSLICDLATASDDEVCLSDTSLLGGLAGDLTGLLRDLSSAPVDLRFNWGIGGVVPSARYPFALSFNVRGTIAGQIDVSDDDLQFSQDLTNTLLNNELTAAEIINTESITVNADGTVSIDEPNDGLSSEAVGTAVIRAELALAMSRELDFNGRAIDVGVIARLARLGVAGETSNLDNDSDSDSDDEDVTEHSVLTFDVGFVHALQSVEGVSIGAVARNILPESVKTSDGTEIESTPQLILSASYEQPGYLLTADLAVNEAKYDNYNTQSVNFGAEVGAGIFKLRGGVHADFALKNPLAVTLGLGIFNVDLGLRASESSVALGFQYDHK